MNVPRSVLQRRQFIRASSTLALGAAAAALATYRLFRGPGHSTSAGTSLAFPRDTSYSASSESTEAILPEVALPEVALPESPTPQLRLLENEDHYTQFLQSLKLRHLSPREIIDPHRGVIGEVGNCLPPLHLWENVTPTLRVADEIRERLKVPLCEITSCYRSPSYNAIVPGSVAGSYHTRNQALDLVYLCPPLKAFRMALQLREEGFFRGGVGLYPTFIHLDTRGHAATWRRI